MRHRRAEDAALLTATQYVTAGISAVATAVTARLLGPTHYGLFAIITAFPLLVVSVVKIKSGDVLTRYLSRFRAERDHAGMRSACKLGYALDFAASSVSCVVIVVLTRWVVGRFAGPPEAAALIIILAASLPLWTLAGTSIAVLSAMEQFRWVAAFQVLQRAIPSLLIVGLLLGGAGIRGAVLGTALGNASVGLLALAAATLVLRQNGAGGWWRASFDAVKHVRGEMAAFFGWNFLRVTWSGVLTQAPVLLIGRLRGFEAAGYLRLAMSVVMVGTYFESSLRRMVYPILSARSVSGGDEPIGHTLRRWTVQLGIPAAATVLVTIPFLPIVVPLAFGSSYRPMIPGAQIMMAGAVVPAALFWLDAFYYATGKIALWTIAYGLFTALILVLAWYGVARWGFLGLAIVLAAGDSIFSFSMAVVASRNGGAGGLRRWMAP